MKPINSAGNVHSKFGMETAAKAAAKSGGGFISGFMGDRYVKSIEKKGTPAEKATVGLIRRTVETAPEKYKAETESFRKTGLEFLASGVGGSLCQVVAMAALKGIDIYYNREGISWEQQYDVGHTALEEMRKASPDETKEYIARFNERLDKGVSDKKSKLYNPKATKYNRNRFQKAVLEVYADNQEGLPEVTLAKSVIKTLDNHYYKWQYRGDGLMDLAIEEIKNSTDKENIKLLLDVTQRVVKDRHRESNPAMDAGMRALELVVEDREEDPVKTIGRLGVKVADTKFIESKYKSREMERKDILEHLREMEAVSRNLLEEAVNLKKERGEKLPDCKDLLRVRTEDEVKWDSVKDIFTGLKERQKLFDEMKNKVTNVREFFGADDSESRNENLEIVKEENQINIGGVKLDIHKK